MYETVLVPTDGSESMQTVVEHARDVAERRDAAVHVLYVVDDRAFFTLEDDRIPDVTDRLYEEGDRAIREVAAAFETAGLDVTTEIRRGGPAEEIVEATTDQDVDLVVMGTHGSDPTRNLLGSTARSVVTGSPVPVHTVPVSRQRQDDLDRESPAPDGD